MDYKPVFYAKPVSGDHLVIIIRHNSIYNEYIQWWIQNFSEDNGWIW